MDRELVDARRETDLAVLEAVRVYAAGTGPDAAPERLTALVEAWALVSDGKSPHRAPQSALRG